MDLKATHLNKAAGPVRYFQNYNYEKSQLVVDPRVSREGSKGTRRSECQAQNQVMGHRALQKERKLAHKENKAEAQGEADRKLCSPRKSGCLVMF